MNKTTSFCAISLPLILSQCSIFFLWMFLIFKYQASVVSLAQDFTFTPFDSGIVPNWSPYASLSLHHFSLNIAFGVIVLKHAWPC